MPDHDPQQPNPAELLAQAQQLQDEGLMLGPPFFLVDEDAPYRIVSGTMTLEREDGQQFDVDLLAEGYKGDPYDSRSAPLTYALLVATAENRSVAADAFHTILVNNGLTQPEGGGSDDDDDQDDEDDDERPTAEPVIDVSGYDLDSEDDDD